MLCFCQDFVSVLSKKTNRSTQTIPQKGNLFLQDKKPNLFPFDYPKNLCLFHFKN